MRNRIAGPASTDEILATDDGFGAQRTVFTSKDVVYGQSDDQPDEKANPGLEWQSEHQHEAGHDREDWQDRRPRDAETSLAIGLAAAQRNHAGRDHHECEQRADI